MATYADLNRAEVGDIVKCIRPEVPGYHDLSGEATYKVNDVKCGHVTLAGFGPNTYCLQRFTLIKRTGAAPAPEPELPKVNGVYASGEVPMVGDVVKALEPHGYVKAGNQYTVKGFNQSGNVVVDFSFGHGTGPLRFKLISRKEQPAVKHKQSPEPLVKWPEESEELGSLKWGTLFVLVNEPHVPCVARSHGDYVPVSGEKAGTIFTKPKGAKVRRIQFNPANKEPVFVVI